MYVSGGDRHSADSLPETRKKAALILFRVAAGEGMFSVVHVPFD